LLLIGIGLTTGRCTLGWPVPPEIPVAPLSTAQITSRIMPTSGELLQTRADPGHLRHNATSFISRVSSNTGDVD